MNRLAHFGLLNEHGLDIGRTIATTRGRRVMPSEELHLFSDGRVCITVLQTVAESGICLLWDRKLWALAPWMPGDAPPPGVEDDGLVIIEFWTVRDRQLPN